MVPQNSIGAYAYWGRNYRWSEDGTQAVWAVADSVGLVDLETGDFQTLLSFPIRHGAGELLGVGADAGRRTGT